MEPVAPADRPFFYSARLMLALLERSVTELGGTYAMEDTDSMAIVASEHGGMIRCNGGSERTPDGFPAIKALSWEQVDQIVKKFEVLNPYERDAVPGSILKIEDDNYENGDPNAGGLRQLFCYAISAKRYALFVKDRSGNCVLLREGVNNHADRWSEHGLGHLLNPTDPECADREWIAQIWQEMISRSTGVKAPEQHFGSLPAVGRISISSPAVMRSLAALNEGKTYTDKIKPFNFILTCHVRASGHPSGTDPERFHLIAPYDSDPRRWLKMKWIDQYSGEQYSITTDADHGNRNAARVKTYDEVAREYEYHPESKCADAEGNTCEKGTTGLLQRRHIHIDLIKYIGKESNSLEDVDAGLIHSEHGVYTEYPNSRRDEWQVKILPALKKIPISDLMKESRLSRSALFEVVAGRSRPHRKNREKLIRIGRNVVG
jgi:hypothetical protein